MATEKVADLAGGTGGANLLPRNVSANIWKEALAQSIVPSISSNVPMILGDNTFPVLTARPRAGIVGEGAAKPHSELKVGSKTVKPVKAVVGLEFTLEAILTNPAGVLGLLEAEMAGALARQIDLAVLHGRDATTGVALTGYTVESVSQLATEVYFGAAPTGTDYDEALWAGYAAVVDAGHDFSGFAFDPRLVTKLAQVRDADGRRLHPELRMGSGETSFEGVSTVVSKSVSGQVDASADTGIRAFAGDFNALKFGHVLDIRTKKIEYGDPFGNGDLQARNSVAYMAEVIFAWGILGSGNLVKFIEGADPTP